MSGRCGLCKHFWYNSELNEDECRKDRRYLDKDDCPNYESDVWE